MPWTYLVSDLNRVEKERNSKKISQKEFRVEISIKRKGDKLYLKWKDYDSTWIDKKDKK